ncbi:uncharacterized protein LOC132195596 [Neocloeon triangulifer]|uniref:uncharacterized protein LOC132195596 n=1 Tax=Neocloeon triangulifer TaxID=2078957 RepID=UPI00286F14CA|nr:uncharacterized protein LOC132195596 [Neocloeon triangulifer]
MKFAKDSEVIFLETVSQDAKQLGKMADFSNSIYGKKISRCQFKGIPYSFLLAYAISKEMPVNFETSKADLLCLVIEEKARMYEDEVTQQAYLNYAKAQVSKMTSDTLALLEEKWFEIEKKTLEAQKELSDKFTLLALRELEVTKKEQLLRHAIYDVKLEQAKQQEQSRKRQRQQEIEEFNCQSRQCKRFR